MKGKKNEYKLVKQKEYCLVDGQHEGIISEELWQKAQEKRLTTGIKYASKLGKERAHLLTGIIKCPKCGCGMSCEQSLLDKKGWHL